MGLLNSESVNENAYLSGMIAESAYLLGTRCKYHEILTSEDLAGTIIDVECDPVREYKDPVLVDVIFSEQQMKRRGDVSTTESEYSQQTIYIPKYDIDGREISVYKYSMIEVIDNPCPVDYPIIGHSAKYDISSVSTSSHQSIYWECKITPHRDQLDVDESTDGVQSTISGSVIMMDSQYINYNPKDVGETT